METGWKQGGNRVETGWKQGGIGVEITWKQSGNLLETEWKQGGNRMGIKRGGKFLPNIEFKMRFYFDLFSVHCGFKCVLMKLLCAQMELSVLKHSSIVHAKTSQVGTHIHTRIIFSEFFVGGFPCLLAKQSFHLLSDAFSPSAAALDTSG